MRNVTISLDVSVKHTSLTHGVASVLGDVHGGSNRVPQLEFVGLDRDDLDQGQLFNKLLGPLVVETVALSVPPGSLQVQSCDIASVVKLLLDVRRAIFFRHHSVHDGFIEWPALCSTSGLNESRQVRFRRV